MKKWCLVLLMLVGCLGARAQRGWSVEPRLGMQAVTVWFANYLGFYAGASGQYRFGRVWAVESGLFYSLDRELSEDWVAINHMMHVPLLAKVYVKKGWNLVLGPQFHIPFAYFNDYFGSRETHFSASGGISVLAGTGYDFPCGLTLHFDYAYGNPRAFQSFKGGELWGYHTFRLGAGWRFGKGK